ncbi:TetR/AcrR family transcriptional regulator [Isoptericola hypogeus]|uniref:TetR/AcrR family transcriptional regulator n=1 Tax=Isoptericola hypogeus TaxID=300179 RepID=A0ABN2JDY1_9MICO
MVNPEGGAGPVGRAPGRSYRQAAERRAEILERAIELFAEHGMDTSLRAIGESIGVSHAALRYYFASRDELLIEVYRQHEAREDEAKKDAADEADEDDEDEPSGTQDVAAVAVMERSAERNRSIPGLVELYATLTTDALQGAKHPLTREFVVERFRRVRADLVERIAAGQRAGSVAADVDPQDAAALVIAASDGLQLQWLLDPDAVDVRRSLAILERVLPGDDAGAAGRDGPA